MEKEVREGGGEKREGREIMQLKFNRKINTMNVMNFQILCAEDLLHGRVFNSG